MKSFRETFCLTVDCEPEKAWLPVVRIGGETGWHYADRLWRFRAALDRLFGGPGMRPGRRDPEELEPGDPVDFWRVVAVRPAEFLLLRAEARLPGEAWMHFTLSRENSATRMCLTSGFVPDGPAGILYWFAVRPLHSHIFRNMLLGAARATGCAVLSGPERNPVSDHVC
ncbi:DUF2867 domain-containing protein [Pseudodesulfovibrio tunisiensis]|uniref:DUF2867 domain-containing protein n=1 Tax=Pseudodesulfovibrio tunisiensis TaxID=463192 RepID=UPI001FB3F09A|nr:DUF2867 domain-containing protein [Pseudodesulfovibrio tunisiensis]